MSDEWKRKFSLARMGHSVSEETRKKIGDSCRGRKQSEAEREVHRQATLKLWQDPEFVDKIVRAQNRRPNKSELKMLGLVEPFGFRYVGDGVFFVANKSPDYWDGEDRLIELYGDHWHEGQNPQDRIDFFEEHGYGCLVVWESELNRDEDEVVARVMDFVGREKCRS